MNYNPAAKSWLIGVVFSVFLLGRFGKKKRGLFWPSFSVRSLDGVHRGVVACCVSYYEADVVYELKPRFPAPYDCVVHDS